MEVGQLMQVFATYEKRLSNASIPPQKALTNRVLNRAQRLSHCRWMCQTMAVMLGAAQQTAAGVQQSEADKANRWLGFVQGILSSENYYTIDEMRTHNR